MRKTVPKTAVFALTVGIVVALVGVPALLQTNTNSKMPPISTSVYPCGKSGETSINGSAYCVADVSNDTQLQNPGYSYFLNGSVEFMGVEFMMICPSNYSGCPGSNGVVTIIHLSATRVMMTFPGNVTETDGAVIGDGSTGQILSNHTAPKAGILIEYGSSPLDTTPSISDYHVFLLVSEPEAISTSTANRSD